MGTLLSDGTYVPDVGETGWGDEHQTNLNLFAKRTAKRIVTTSQFADLAAILLHSGDILTDGTATWTAVGGFGGAIAVLDTVNKTQGTGSIKADLSHPSVGTPGALYCDLVSAVAVGARAEVSVDVRFSLESDPGTHKAFEVVIATGAGLTGTTSAISISDTNLPTTDVWGSIRVPVGGVTSVKSVGIRRRSSATGGAGSKHVTYNLDQPTIAAAGKLDVALTSDDPITVVVEPDYSSAYTQGYRNLGSTKSVDDPRPAKANKTRFRGVYDVRDFFIDETGATNVVNDLQRIFDLLPSRSKLTFPPEGIFLVDGNVVLVDGRSYIEFDSQGCRFIQSQRRNEQMFTFEGYGLEVHGSGIFGRHITTTNASSLTKIAGSPTVSGTSMLLDALDEEVRVPAKSASEGGMTPGYGRDHLGYIQCDLVLSDTAAVAGDCVVTVTDHYGAETAYTTALTLTATPTTYAIRYQPTDLHARSRITIRKATATANTITIASFSEYNEAKYSGSYPFNHGIRMSAKASLIEDVLIESMGGDAVTSLNGDGLTVRNFLFRANGRQSFSFNQGNDPTLEDGAIIFAGRSGVDLEPETTNVEVLDGKIRNVVLSQPANASFTATAFSRVRRIEMDNVEFMGDAGAFFEGGFDDGVIRNCTVRWLGLKTMLLKNAGATGGTFTITYKGDTTSAIPWNANKNTVKTFLDGVPVTLGAWAAGSITFTTSAAHNLSVGQTVYVWGQVPTGYNGTFVVDTTPLSTTFTVVAADPGAYNGGQSSGNATRINGIRPGSPEVPGDVSVTGDLVNGLLLAWAPRLGDVPMVTASGAGLTGSTTIAITLNKSWYPGNFSVYGRNMTIQGMQSDSGFRNELATKNDTGQQPITSGYNVFRGLRLLRPLYQGLDGDGSNTGMLIDATGTSHWEDVRAVGSGPALNTAFGSNIASVVPVQFATGTTWRDIDPRLLITELGGTYKGLVAGPTYHPRGMDLLASGLLAVRAISASSRRGNNLNRVAVVVAAGATSIFIPFPAKTDVLNPGAFTSAAATTGGTMAGATYFYRVAGRGPQTGPLAALGTERSALVASPNNAITLRISTLFNTTSDMQVSGLTIYRGVATTVYDTRYDLIPNADFWGAGHINLGDTFFLKDLGTALTIDPTGNNVITGFPLSTAVTATTSHPSWDGTKWVVQDETGWEPDLNIAVVGQASWQTTAVPTKARNGITWTFGVACPVGGGFFDQMLQGG